MQEYPPQPKNRNMPLIVCGVVAAGCVLLFIPIMAAILFPVFAQARSSAQRVSCLSNLKQQGLGLLMYSQDYDETFPKAAIWMDAVDPYIKNQHVFHCPALHDNPGAFGYAYDKRLSSAELADIIAPETAAMVYDSTEMGQNASDASQSLPQDSAIRHNGDNIDFVDGHAKGYMRINIADEISAIAKDPIDHSREKTKTKH